MRKYTLINEDGQPVLEITSGIDLPTMSFSNNVQKVFNGRLADASEDNYLPCPVNLDMAMNFGKHKGRTLEDLLDNEPGYLSWLAEEIKKKPDNPTNFSKAVVALHQWAVQTGKIEPSRARAGAR